MAFERHKKAAERKRSVVVIVEALLSLKDAEGIHKPHLKRFLSNALWMATLAEGKGKYKTRYVSQGALDAKPKERRHEHVFKRKDMVKALLKNPKDAAAILATAVGCIVTKAEHDRLELAGDYDGWRRYVEAKIRVFDTLKEKDADLERLSGGRKG